ncbi:protein phosphatase 1 regulatory subunit 17 isoform X2 [Larus michahellis]|uniref:protein phosphatase 1 regulatory subunit 17 isoform X2 n=1 Tax=Larus michahellis TaxID=119627 RepID=UPI003D9BC342
MIVTEVVRRQEAQKTESQKGGHKMPVLRRETWRGSRESREERRLLFSLLALQALKKNKPQNQLLSSRAYPDKKIAVLSLPSSHDGHQGSDWANQLTSLLGLLCNPPNLCRGSRKDVCVRAICHGRYKSQTPLGLRDCSSLEGFTQQYNKHRWFPSWTRDKRAVFQDVAMIFLN